MSSESPSCWQQARFDCELSSSIHIHYKNIYNRCEANIRRPKHKAQPSNIDCLSLALPSTLSPIHQHQAQHQIQRHNSLHAVVVIAFRPQVHRLPVASSTRHLTSVQYLHSVFVEILVPLLRSELASPAQYITLVPNREVVTGLNNHGKKRRD